MAAGLARDMVALLQLYLPVLFPSWRFFGEIGASPRVEFWSDGLWVNATSRPGRMVLSAQLLRLVWNPDWNEKLYLVSLAERMLVAPCPALIEEIAARVVRRHALALRPKLRIMLVTDQSRSIAWESHPDEP